MRSIAFALLYCGMAYEQWQSAAMHIDRGVISFGIMSTIALAAALVCAIMGW